MNRDEHPTDEYVRRLPLVGDEQARRLVDEDAKQALLQEIIDTPADARELSHTGASRHRRGAVLALAAASLAVVGWTVYQALDQTAQLTCHTGDGGATIDSVSGDPVADCAAFWKGRTGTPAPRLVAYDNGHGGIAVAPAGQDVPARWQRLEEGFSQDPRLIELRSALDDYIDGLAADCYTTVEATSIADRELSRLGLDDWTVTPARGQADGETTCAAGLVDPDTETIELFPLQTQRPRPRTSYVVLADRLREAFGGDACYSLEEAATLAREQASELGMQEADHQVWIRDVNDPTVTCTRVELNVYGTVEIELRGPSANH